MLQNLRLCEARNVTSLIVRVNRQPNSSRLAHLHERSPVGVLLRADATLRYRLTDNTPNDSFTVDIVNYDRNFEHSLIVNEHAFRSFVVTHDSVPFVRWTQQPAHCFIEFEIEGEHTPLPMYNTQLSVDVFKQRYADSLSEYAYLDLGAVAMLVPPADKQTVLTALDFEPLVWFYNAIRQHYDKLAGLRVDAKPQLADSSRHVQFFIKADAGGPGDQYFGDSYIANCADTLGPFLVVSTTNWPVLHQLGHAYDLHFTVQQSNLVEVWSSLFADHLQYVWMDASERRTLASIFEGEERETIEASILSELMKSNVSFDDDLDVQQRVVLLSFVLKSQFGPATWLRLYKLPPPPNDINVFLAMILECRADLMAYLSLIGVSVPRFRHVEDLIYANAYPFSTTVALHKPILYPVKLLINDFDVSNNDYDLKQFLDSNLSLVTRDQLSQTKLVALDTRIDCNIDDATQIVGEPYEVFDGDQLVHSGRVSADLRIVVPRLSRGVYLLRPPRGKDKRYKIRFDNLPLENCTYLIIDGITDAYVLEYERYVHSDLTVYRGHIISPINQYCASFYLDFESKTIIIDVYYNNILPATPDAQFVTVTVTQPDDRFQLLGSGTPLGRHSIDFATGSVLKITTTSFEHSSCVIFNNSLVYDSYTLLDDHIYEYPNTDQILESVNQASLWLDAHPNMLFVENEVRDDIYLAVDHFKGTDLYDELVTIFQHYFPIHFRPYYDYMFVFNNSAGRPLMILLCDTLFNVAQYYAFKGTINEAFGSDIYMGVELYTDDELQFSRFFVGNQSLASGITVHDIPIAEGSLLRMLHAEPMHLKLYKHNELQDVTFSTSETELVLKRFKFVEFVG
ncbi:enhancin-1 [Betabaculovirus altermyunipunctae]|uniref:Enhancin-1 n=1 Tax=Betabaculovirus altermyunipunctae TaxID=3051996 RepID=A0A1S5YE20_9BBAC|nr:enhancin-1 [Betabaculovirus altermyunipunctae]AQQ80401.1 enhancin-1 [Betabaculovirus altermyunipunctae]